MIKGVIFDLDGVLIDTEYFQWQGWIEVLKPFGVPLSREEYFNYAGKTGEMIDAELIKKYNLKIRKGSLSEAKKKLLMKWFKSKPITLMPYAREAVEFFLKEGTGVAVASGAPGEETELKLKRTGLHSLFQVIVSRSDVQRGKPHPDIYLLAAKKLDLKPGDCVAFEDTQYGLESAKSAGLACLAVPNEFSEKQDFSRADRVFRNLKEAVDWVKKNQG